MRRNPISSFFLTSVTVWVHSAGRLALEVIRRRQQGVVRATPSAS